MIWILSWAHSLLVRTYPPIKPSAIPRMLQDVKIETIPPTFVILIVWDPMPASALSHGSSLDGNDPLLRHVSRVYFSEWQT